MRYQDTLKDTNIGHTTAHNWQRSASIPEDEFDRYITETLSQEQELTTAGVVRLADKIERENAPEAALTPDLPDGKYRSLVLDPAWPMKKIKREVRPKQGYHLDYPTLTLEAIAALPVGPSGIYNA